MENTLEIHKEQDAVMTDKPKAQATIAAANKSRRLFLGVQIFTLLIFITYLYVFTYAEWPK